MIFSTFSSRGDVATQLQGGARRPLLQPRQQSADALGWAAAWHGCDGCHLNYSLGTHASDCVRNITEWERAAGHGQEYGTGDRVLSGPT